MTDSADQPLISKNEKTPFAIVDGNPLLVPPEDLYIPPQALEVFLDTFEGPLDLLLYLIKKQNLDILNIPIAEITEQYMGYVEMMRTIKLDLAAEYLVMAALLAEIKSRMLLPRHENIDDEDDPRAELVKRLQAYEQFKQVSYDIDELGREGRDFWSSDIEPIYQQEEKALPDIELEEILLAFKNILNRADMNVSHEIQREALSVRERMSHILASLQASHIMEFTQLFDTSEGKAGVVVTFVAVLELLKEHLVDIVQSEAFAPIYLQSASQSTE
ncbi:MAG: segregation/condensation protein A [Thiotrichaceae bacterium]|nr:segregation/condensation protein A [Thiotrichaceae bacterium]